MRKTSQSISFSIADRNDKKLNNEEHIPKSELS